MEATLDPATGQPLPPDAIQRVLFIAPSLHVYNIPPLASTKGYVAATWTADNNKRQIFTARLRIIETAVPSTGPTSNSDGETVKTDILLEDPANGALFAAAPYTDLTAVEQVLDSSRFFAVRVQDPQGRKVVLGIGFEERSEAFDFSVALQEVRRTLGIEDVDGRAEGKKKQKEAVQEKKDFSLKEGETITVKIGGRGRRSRDSVGDDAFAGAGGLGGFSLPPPPSNGGIASFLAPPPSAQEVKKNKRMSQNLEMQAPVITGSMEDMGFDDGEFGEFQ